MKEYAVVVLVVGEQNIPEDELPLDHETPTLFQRGVFSTNDPDEALRVAESLSKSLESAT